jgi:hypothetical protein
MDNNKLLMLNTDSMQLLSTLETPFITDTMSPLLEPPITFGYGVRIMLSKK